MPRAHLPAGLAQHEPADRDDQPGLLGQRDEVQRRDQPAVGVLPADQRLDAGQPAGRQFDDRLVVDDELAVLDGAGRAPPSAAS